MSSHEKPFNDLRFRQKSYYFPFSRLATGHRPPLNMRGFDFAALLFWWRGASWLCWLPRAARYLHTSRCRLMFEPSIKTLSGSASVSVAKTSRFQDLPADVLSSFEDDDTSIFSLRWGATRMMPSATAFSWRFVYRHRRAFERLLDIAVSLIIRCRWMPPFFARIAIYCSAKMNTLRKREHILRYMPLKSISDVTYQFDIPKTRMVACASRISFWFAIAKVSSR